jgi:hypothetical protein
MTDFKPGEIVDITIKGACVTNCYPTAHEDADGTRTDTGTVLVVSLDGARRDDRSVAVNIATPGVTVERVAPAEWPPRAGDLWRDRHGHLHFAAYYAPDYCDREDSRGIDSVGVRVVLLPQGLSDGCVPGQQMYRPETANQDNGPLTLVHREEAGS